MMVNVLPLLLSFTLPAAAADVSLGDKGLTVADKDAGVEFNLDLLFQPRYTFELSGDPSASDEAALDGTGFRNRRLLLRSSGKVHPRISYVFRVNFAGTTAFDDADGKSQLVASPTVDDARLDFKLAEPFQLAFGRYKVPYSANWLTGIDSMVFAERSPVVDGLKTGSTKLTGFTQGRDTGAMAHGTFLEKELEWSLGVFSGDGGLQWKPADLGYLYAFRLDWAPLGQYRLHEADLKRGDPLLGIGVNATLDNVPVHGDAGKLQSVTRTAQAGGDLRFAARGVSLLAEGHLGLPVDPGEGTTSMGFFLQGTYAFADLPLVPGLRVSRLDPDTEAEDDAFTMGEVALDWLLPRKGAEATADLSTRRKLLLTYTTAMQDGAENLLFHQVMLGAQVAL